MKIKKKQIILIPVRKKIISIPTPQTGIVPLIVPHRSASFRILGDIVPHIVPHRSASFRIKFRSGIPWNCKFSQKLKKQLPEFILIYFELNLIYFRIWKLRSAPAACLCSKIEKLLISHVFGSQSWRMLAYARDSLGRVDSRCTAPYDCQITVKC